MHIYNKSCFKKYIFALLMLGITQFATAQMTQNYRSPNFWDNVRFGGGLGLGFGNDFFSGSITPSAIYQVNDLEGAYSVFIAQLERFNFQQNLKNFM